MAGRVLDDVLDRRDQRSAGQRSDQRSKAAAVMDEDGDVYEDMARSASSNSRSSSLARARQQQ
jgi:hypothetical protein